MTTLTATQALNMNVDNDFGILINPLTNWTSDMHHFVAAYGDTVVRAEGLFLTSGGKPTSSAITKLTVERSGSPAYVLSDFPAVTLPDLSTALQTSTPSEIFASFLGGSDTINGSKFADLLNGYDGLDTIFGKGGNDKIFGGDGFDQLYGGAGKDLIVGGNDSDVLYGGGGNDRMLGGDGEDSLLGEAGSDRMLGGDGKDYFRGGAGKDIIDGGKSVEDTATYTEKSVAVVVKLDGSKAVSVLVGGAVEDSIKRIENLRGGDGDDKFTGDGAWNTLEGNGGNDFLSGRGGNDTMRGGQGNDRMLGGAGSDFLNGDEGADRIDGQSGIDNILGGYGNDRLTGGTGADYFYFHTTLSALNNVDTITDFKHGVDQIVLTRDIFTAISQIEEDTLSFFALGAAQDANDHVIYDQASGKLYYDEDGNGAAAAILFARVDKGTTVSVGDFEIL